MERIKDVNINSTIEVRIALSNGKNKTVIALNPNNEVNKPIFEQTEAALQSSLANQLSDLTNRGADDMAIRANKASLMSQLGTQIADFYRTTTNIKDVNFEASWGGLSDNNGISYELALGCLSLAAIDKDLSDNKEVLENVKSEAFSRCTSNKWKDIVREIKHCLKRHGFEYRKINKIMCVTTLPKQISAEVVREDQEKEVKAEKESKKREVRKQQIEASEVVTKVKGTTVINKAEALNYLKEAFKVLEKFRVSDDEFNNLVSEMTKAREVAELQSYDNQASANEVAPQEGETVASAKAELAAE